MRLLAAILTLSFIASCDSERKILIPVQQNEFVNIYSPKGDHFPSPDSAGGLRYGEWYDEWVPNDHCFVRGEDGVWHIYGITHPLTPLEHIHSGEDQLFHAKSPAPAFKSSLVADSWSDEPKLLAPADRAGEIAACHAPSVIERDGVYHMVYGPSPIRFATSQDLMHWQPTGEVFREERGARDPHLLQFGDTYYMVFCTERKVGIRSSKDLKEWSQTQIIFDSTEFDPESPFLLPFDGRFYLFVCSWDGVNKTNDVHGAYQYTTYVYVTQSIGELYDAKRPICRLNGHAPEIFQDEAGDWYISSAEYPYRGINVDRLRWE